MPNETKSPAEWAPSQGLDSRLVREHLDRILQSPAMGKSQRRKDLLEWLVSAALEGRAGEISERAVAAEVFGRSGDFDSGQDSIVRVEIGRLRSKLEAFYLEEGRDETIRISIPKGSYAPRLVRVVGRAPSPAAPAEAESPARPEVIAGLPAVAVIPPANSWLRRLRLFAVLLVVPAMILGAALTLARWGNAPRGPRLIRVTDLPGRQVQPSLSPDGSRVAFAWDAEGFGSFQIYVKPVRNGSATPLTPGPEPARSPAWSPDGRSIAYLRTLPNHHQDVMLIPAQGGVPRLVTTVGTNVVGIAWTPDSRNLIVPAGGGNGLLALFLVSVATGQRTQLTPSDSYFHPAVSPDGRTLAFATDRQTGGLGALCTLPLGPDYLPAGTVKVFRETVSPTVFWPSWSPDGRYVLFTKGSSGKSSLYRVPVAGGEPQSVAETGASVFAGREISPGSFLLVRQREFVFQAKVLPGEQGTGAPAKVLPLFKHSDLDVDADLSPDGKRIAFSIHRPV